MDDTLTWSPCVDEDTPLGAFSLMNLLMALAWSEFIPALMVTSCADRTSGRFLDLAEVEGPRANLSADELLFQYLYDGLQAVLRRGPQRHLMVCELDRRARALEVEPGGKLALRLVYSVADLLHVHL